LAVEYLASVALKENRLGDTWQIPLILTSHHATPRQQSAAQRNVTNYHGGARVPECLVESFVPTRAAKTDGKSLHAISPAGLGNFATNLGA
jgi:hypothetical protein